MKNNRGWGLRSELWICLALIIFFAIAVILINNVVERLRETDIIESESLNTEIITEPIIKKEDEIIKDNNSDHNNQNNTIEYNYSNLEDELVSATKLYVNKYYSSKEVNGILKVTVVRLKTEELLKPLMYNDTECSGYVQFEKSDNGTMYYPYIKCGDIYKTSGYLEANDNLDL